MGFMVFQNYHANFEKIRKMQTKMGIDNIYKEVSNMLTTIR